MATKRLTTVQHFTELADEVTGHIVDRNALKASQTKEIDTIKEGYSPKIAALAKLITGSKNRLSNFAKKNGIKIFNGAKTGSIKTNRSHIKLHKNPASIKKIDKDADDKELVLEAKRMGFGNVLKFEEVFSIEAMEKLTDSELQRLGYKRAKKNFTFTIDALEDSDLKEKVSITEEEGSSQ
jgi:phage host-nuclease inhibitor protein Gam